MGPDQQVLVLPVSSIAFRSARTTDLPAHRHAHPNRAPPARPSRSPPRDRSHDALRAPLPRWPTSLQARRASPLPPPMALTRPSRSPGPSSPATTRPDFAKYSWQFVRPPLSDAKPVEDRQGFPRPPQTCRSYPRKAQAAVRHFRHAGQARQGHQPRTLFHRTLKTRVTVQRRKGDVIRSPIQHQTAIPHNQDRFGREEVALEPIEIIQISDIRASTCTTTTLTPSSASAAATGTSSTSCESGVSPPPTSSSAS